MEKTNKEILAENLNYYMVQKHIDRYQLCEALNFKYSTVSEWLSAKKYPRMDKIELLANYFDINKSDLIEKSANSIIQKIPYDEVDCVRIPLIGRVAAGYCCHAEDNISAYVLTDSDILKDGYEHFWLEVKGDSMEPELHENDFVLVRKQEVLDKPCYAVVTVDNEDGVVKLVDIQNTKITLNSVNPYYPPRVFERENMNRVKLIGKVIQVKRNIE